MVLLVCVPTLESSPMSGFEERLCCQMLVGLVDGRQTLVHGPGRELVPSLGVTSFVSDHEFVVVTGGCLLADERFGRKEASFRTGAV